eukprot:11412789-Alexandrium_andersonii.AAC.1
MRSKAKAACVDAMNACTAIFKNSIAKGFSEHEFKAPDVIGAVAAKLESLGGVVDADGQKGILEVTQTKPAKKLFRR